MSRADSNTLKARKAGKADAHRLKLALEVYTAEQLKPKNEHRSLRDVANEFHINHTTLSQHYKGGVLMSSFNSLKQKLTVVEVKVL
jgi:hypothetical protein